MERSNKRTKAQCIIKDVVPYKEMETQCIAVDAPDKLFVIENYIQGQINSAPVNKDGEKTI